MGAYCLAAASFVAPAYYTKTLCPAGTYNPNTAQRTPSACLPCPSGYYCAIAGLSAISATQVAASGPCSPGYFCQSSSTTPTPATLVANYYGPCPTGYWCPDGINTNACPMGTFSPSTNAISNTVCQPCTQGYYCPTTGMSLPALLCSVGYYCPEGSATQYGGALASPTTQNACPTNYYCPQGAWRPILCPVGYYQDQTAQGFCNICPSGYFCVMGLRNVCPAGYNCP